MIGAELMRLIALILIIYSTPVFAGQTVATWYGNEHAGKRTASGERFNPNGLTAAHRSLPFGTCVRVLACVQPRVWQLTGAKCAAAQRLHGAVENML